jgi:hypothetical protein
MKIVVYMETPRFDFAEVIAHFASDELYMACLPALEQYAKDSGYVITESVREDEQITDAFDEETTE